MFHMDINRAINRRCNICIKAGSHETHQKMDFTSALVHTHFCDHLNKEMDSDIALHLYSTVIHLSHKFQSVWCHYNLLYSNNIK